MDHCEIVIRGVVANPNTMAHHLENFKNLFGLQEGPSSICVPPTDRATFRIHRQMDLKITLASKNKNDFFNIGTLDLPANALLNAFLAAKHHAFGAGYIVGETAIKNIERAIKGGGLANIVIHTVELTRPVEKPMTPKQKSLSVVVTAFLFLVFDRLNKERNKELVAIGLPPI